jgi:hypothetical protein
MYMSSVEEKKKVSRRFRVKTEREDLRESIVVIDLVNLSNSDEITSCEIQEWTVCTKW